MTRTRKPPQLDRHRRQGGSIIMFAAIGLSLIIILLSITNIGFLYYYKREYQKAADLAAMAGARSLIAANGSVSCTNATSAASSSVASNLGSKNYSPITVTCGKWNPAAATIFDTTVATSQLNGVRAIVSGAPPRFLPFTPAVTLTAQATAIVDQPVAALNIRSQIASVDSSQGALLNSITGGLLGGAVNLSVASWSGILNTNVNLLKYLDALAVQAGVSAGNYDQLLNTNVTLGQLLNAGVSALNAGGGTGDVSAALGGLGQLAALNLPGFTPLLRVGDLLSVQTGTPTSGLDTNLNLFSLVQGSIQLANSECAACISLPINVPGILNASVRAKVIEPPQVSAIGNPALAAADPMGANRIYVRTAQVRTLITADLSGLTSIVTQILNAVTGALGPITSLLNSVLNLNLLEGVGNLLGSLVCGGFIPCPVSQVVDAQVLSNRLDVSLDAGGGSAYVSGYSCANDASSKTLTVPATTSVAALRVGNLGTTAANPTGNVFSSSAIPTVTPVELANIAYLSYRPDSCLLAVLCAPGKYQTAAGTWTTDKTQAKRNIIASITARADTTVVGSSQTLNYAAPPASSLPTVDLDPYYQSINASTNVVNTLSSTLANINIQIYSSPSAGVLGAVLSDVNGLLNGLITTLRGVISGLLSPLLDPLVNLLLNSLGINLNQVDVGARLTCSGSGATLVD